MFISRTQELYRSFCRTLETFKLDCLKVFEIQLFQEGLQRKQSLILVSCLLSRPWFILFLSVTSPTNSLNVTCAFIHSVENTQESLQAVFQLVSNIIQVLKWLSGHMHSRNCWRRETAPVDTFRFVFSVLDSHESYKRVVNHLGSIKALLICFVLWSGKLVCMFITN